MKNRIKALEEATLYLLYKLYEAGTISLESYQAHKKVIENAGVLDISSKS